MHGRAQKIMASAGATHKPAAPAPASAFAALESSQVLRHLLRSGTIQAKLTVSQPGDPFEQEADQVAEQVMRMPVASPPLSSADAEIQRKGSCDKASKEEEEKVQTKEAPGRTPSITPRAEAHVESLRGGGQPLPGAVRSFFEPRFGRDFSGVRVHSGSRANEAASAVQARAFTLGKDIVFAAGEFAPQSEEGQRLLAHELVHIGQQEQGGRDRSGILRKSSARHDSENQKLRNSASVTAEPKPETPSTALIVMRAIIDILKNDHALPKDHPEVPARYRRLLQEWHQIRAGHTRSSGGEVFTTGAMLQTHIRLAMKETMSLVDVLADEGNAATRLWLTSEFFPEVDRLGQRALREEVDESIEAASKAPMLSNQPLSEAPDNRLKLLAEGSLMAVRKLNTVVNRYLNAEARKFSNEQKAQAQFRKSDLEHGHVLTPGQVLAPLPKMSAPEALWYVKGVLDLLQGGLGSIETILSATDPEKRKTLLAEWYSKLGKATPEGMVKDVAEKTTVIGQYIFGAVSILGSVTYKVAVIRGMTSTAVSLLAKGPPALMAVQVALNVVGIVHGLAVLLDSESTGKEKTSGFFELALSTMGVAAYFWKAAKPFSGPVSAGIFAADIATSMATEIAKIPEIVVNIARGGLGACFDDMEETTKRVHGATLRLAVAADMAARETDPERKVVLDEKVNELQHALVEDLLKPYIERATNPQGARWEDPARWGPSLINRFKPLRGRRMDTVEQAIQAASEFFAIATLCAFDAEKILPEVVDWLWKEYRDR
jgi:hypothetical protein